MSDARGDDDYSSQQEADEPTGSSGYRSYEVYQRERVGQTTNLVNPRDLLSEAYLLDPFTIPGIMREHYPCYRDWVSNRFWITRYDDVTSVFSDDANFETRPRRAVYGSAVVGTDLNSEAEIPRMRAARMESDIDLVVGEVLDQLSDRSTMCLVGDFAQRVEALLWSRTVGLDPTTDREALAALYEFCSGVTWDEAVRLRGIEAFGEATRLLDPLLDARRNAPTDDLLGAAASLGATGADMAVTVLETRGLVLGPSLVNLWSLLLRNPEQCALVRDEPRLMKSAYLESLRHSPVVATADRYARHEIERFGRLIPQGALLHLSAAAANRDPRQFAHPDAFDILRKDLCAREPRGQHRADGLPAGITFAHGKPSSQPAVPKEAPRSSYAIVRDLAVQASRQLFERFPSVHIDATEQLELRLDRIGGSYTSSGFDVNLA